jgi:ribonucleotide reductase beta subunit family protein with ferritin-like domain
MRKTFFFRPDVVEACRRGEHSGAPRAAAWRRAFPDAEPAIAGGAAALFPATAPETFARWLEIRSAIDKETEAGEPLLRAETDRPTILPLRDGEMWEFRNTLQRLHWLASEVDLSLDARDLAKVTDEDRKLLWDILGFFGVADELIMEGIDGVAAPIVRRKEGQFYLRAQCDQECVHSEAYSLQIQEIVPAERREAVFNAVKTNPAVGRMADWARWWVLAEHPAADVFAAMAFLEGVLFSGFFAALQHYKVRGLFPGVTGLNEFIARDEGVHTLFWCFLLTKRLDRPPDRGVVEAVARETVALSAAFFARAIPAPIVGLNAGLLDQYVRFVADAVLIQTGNAAVFGDANPFGFMDMISLNEVARSNFFESRVSAYQNIGMEGALRFEIDESPIGGA